MRKWIVLAAALFFAVFAGPRGYEHVTRFNLPTSTWSTVCNMTKEIYSCDGVTPPQMKFYDGQFGDPYGWYDGGDTIYVDRNTSTLQMTATMFHESVHYLQERVGGVPIPGPINLICAAEDEAFMLTDIYVDFVLGHPEMKRYEGWWLGYPHCWQWRGVSFIIILLDP